MLTPGWGNSGGSLKKVSQNISGEWNNISKARITARNKLLTKFVYKYAFLSKESYQCILTSDHGYDIIESIKLYQYAFLPKEEQSYDRT